MMASWVFLALAGACHITDLTTVLTRLLIHLVENLLVRRFFAKQVAVACTALFSFLSRKQKQKKKNAP